MQIWVDADACPVVIRDIVCRAAERTRVPACFVANHHIGVPISAVVKMLQVPGGFDIADNEIVKRVAADDVVITSDIPLAAEAMEKGAHALSPRGEMHTPDTIRQRLNVRDFMDSMRASGIHTGGPPPLGTRERQNFANHLDRLLAQRAG